MPELPEVETVINSLRPFLINQEIISVNVKVKNLVAYPEVDVFIDELTNKKIIALARRGKYILIKLNDNKTLIVHLRMTGKLLIKESDQELDKHTHIIMKLESGKELRFNNIRKFGRLYLIDNGHPEQAGGLAKLGPEPLSEDFTEKDFKKLFKGRHGVIKSLLMNQKFIAGLGNIYADEILYRAGIDPERKADKISEQEQVELYHIMREILRAGIKFGGTSFSDYVNGLGEKGSFQEELLVYQQSGQACERCSEEIIKKKVGGRSSYYCPGCQK